MEKIYQMLSCRSLLWAWFYSIFVLMTCRIKWRVHTPWVEYPFQCYSTFSHGHTLVNSLQISLRSMDELAPSYPNSSHWNAKIYWINSSVARSLGHLAYFFIYKARTTLFLAIVTVPASTFLGWATFLLKMPLLTPGDILGIPLKLLKKGTLTPIKFQQAGNFHGKPRSWPSYNSL